MTQNSIIGMVFALLAQLFFLAVIVFGLYKVLRIEKDTREIKAMLAELKAQMKG